MDLQLSQSSESTDDSVDSKTFVISAPAARKRRTTRADLNDEEYKRRRERNNEAVRKCRIKSREKSKEMAEKVHFLREENAVLTQKVQILSKELTLLKELFLSHATGGNKTSIVNVIALSQAATTDATVPQTSDHSDHEYFQPVSAVGTYIKLEELGSDEEEPESIVDLSVKRPGIVFDRSENDSILSNNKNEK